MKRHGASVFFGGFAFGLQSYDLGDLVDLQAFMTFCLYMLHVCISSQSELMNEQHPACKCRKRTMQEKGFFCGSHGKS